MNGIAIDVLQNEQEDSPAPEDTGERMVFLVPSSKRPGVKYRVDLLANNGAGWCQCPDFGCRKQVNLDAGATTWMGGTSCRHTRKAARYFLRRILATMAHAETTP